MNIFRKQINTFVPKILPLFKKQTGNVFVKAFDHHLFSTTSASNTVGFTIIDGEGESKEVTGKIGQTLLEIGHENDVDIEGACGGELACSTCHCILEKRIFDMLDQVSEEEEDMLDLAWGLQETSRLGCQIKLNRHMEGMVVRIPEETNNMM